MFFLHDNNDETNVSVVASTSTSPSLKLNSIIKPSYCNLHKLQVSRRMLSDSTQLMFLPWTEPKNEPKNASCFSLVGNCLRYLFLSVFSNPISTPPPISSHSCIYPRIILEDKASFHKEKPSMIATIVTFTIIGMVLVNT